MQTRLRWSPIFDLHRIKAPFLYLSISIALLSVLFLSTTNNVMLPIVISKKVVVGSVSIAWFMFFLGGVVVLRLVMTVKYFLLIKKECLLLSKEMQKEILYQIEHVEVTYFLVDKLDRLIVKIQRLHKRIDDKIGFIKTALFDDDDSTICSSEDGVINKDAFNKIFPKIMNEYSTFMANADGEKQEKECSFVPVKEEMSEKDKTDVKNGSEIVDNEFLSDVRKNDFLNEMKEKFNMELALKKKSMSTIYEESLNASDKSEHSGKIPRMKKKSVSFENKPEPEPVEILNTDLELRCYSGNQKESFIKPLAVNSLTDFNMPMILEESESEGSTVTSIGNISDYSDERSAECFIRDNERMLSLIRKT